MHYVRVTPPPPPTTAIFRTFKKSTALYKVHNMGFRYIKFIWFGFIARLSNWGGGGYLLVQITFTRLCCAQKKEGGSAPCVGEGIRGGKLLPAPFYSWLPFKYIKTTIALASFSSFLYVHPLSSESLVSNGD